MDDTNERILNPWLSIWTKPRATIQQIVQTNARERVILLTAVEGFSSVLNHASFRRLGDKYDWPIIFVIAAVAGTIGGIIGLYLAGALISWTGKWLGGEAPSQHIRAAIAWSGVPTIWALILWIPQLLLFGQDLFTTEAPRIHANPSSRFILLGFVAIELIVAIWAMVVFLKCLAQVQGFSAWKALGNSTLGALFVVVPIAIIAIIIVFLVI